LGICGSKSVVRLEYLVGVFNHTAIREHAEDRQIISGEPRSRDVFQSF
jgi:hypothetical protein